MLFALDPLHKKVSPEFRKMFGYGAFVPPVIGGWYLVLAGLVASGHPIPAQRMLATVMGGVIYSHAVAEGDVKGVVAPAIFLGMSVFCASTITQATIAVTLAIHGALALAGFTVGYVVTYLSGGAPPGKKGA